MKLLLGAIPVALPVLLCQPVEAETALQAYGVTSVGNAALGTGVRGSHLGTRPYILVGGYYSRSDGGGGYFALGPSGCTDNGGTILQDFDHNCFYRTDERAAIPVQWFGARCDAVTNVYGSTLIAGSNTYTPTGPGFQSSDVGKVIEFFPVSASGAVNPFRTKIDSVSGGAATLHTAAHNTYPGSFAASDARFTPILLDGLDAPGSGYKPQDVLQVVGGGGVALAATVTVTGTGLVTTDITTAGSGYSVGELISLVADGSTVAQTRQPAQIRVKTISPSRGVTAYDIINPGVFTSGSGHNPGGLSAISPTGTGFAVALSGDASFGVAEVKLVNGGSYTSPPALPAATNDTGLGTGTGATVNLSFPTPHWTYGSDDTVALANLEAFIENDANRGLYNAAEVPGDQACLLSSLKINRAVTWRSSGSRQAQLQQMIGATPATVDGTRNAFVVVAANLPAFDVYQEGVGQTSVGLSNITIAGGTQDQTVDVEGSTGVSYTNDGLLFQDPTGANNTNIAIALENLQVASFPGNAMSAYRFNGEFRGYNIFVGDSKLSCFDLEKVANPTRLYGFIAGHCATGINLVSSQTQEFHGASVFANDIDISVTGTRASPRGYIVFDNLQLGQAKNANMYLDQQNETVICVSNCTFKDMNAGQSSGGVNDSAIVIGPDASNALGQTNTILRLNQGYIDPSGNTGDYQDIRFDTGGGTTTCICTVALGDGMIDLANGTVSTNKAAQLAGPLTYGGPSAGQALTVGAAELGLGISNGSETAPNGSGVKFRIECATNRHGKVKIMLLTGASSTPVTLLDDVGDNGSVSQCN